MAPLPPGSPAQVSEAAATQVADSPSGPVTTGKRPASLGAAPTGATAHAAANERVTVSGTEAITAPGGFAGSNSSVPGNAVSAVPAKGARDFINFRRKSDGSFSPGPPSGSGSAAGGAAGAGAGAHHQHGSTASKAASILSHIIGRPHHHAAAGDKPPATGPPAAAEGPGSPPEHLTAAPRAGAGSQPRNSYEEGTLSDRPDLHHQRPSAAPGYHSLSSSPPTSGPGALSAAAAAAAAAGGRPSGTGAAGNAPRGVSLLAPALEPAPGATGGQASPPLVLMPAPTSAFSGSAGGSPAMSFSGPGAGKPASKPQQLLNKLKLRKRSGTGLPSGMLVTGSSGISDTASSGLILASSSGTIPVGPPAAHQQAPGQSFTLTQPVDSDVEEFSPGASHPTNPLAPLLHPFRMMKPLVPAVASRATAAAVAGIKRVGQRRAAAAAAAAAAAGRLKQPVVVQYDSNPPMGYLWLWMGNFMRWQRRFIVASEAPGVVLIYKRMNMKGKVWSISLRGATVAEDDSDPRQLKIVTDKGQIFLRALQPEERTLWVTCLRQSIELYAQSQHMVEELKGKGLLPQQVMSGAGGLSGQLGGGGGNGPTTIHLPDTADMDVEQRKRIRARMTERLSEIVPYQQEVERHMALLSSQLLGVVSGLNIRLPAMTPSNSLLKLTTFHSAAAAPPPGVVATPGQPGVPPRSGLGSAAAAGMPGPVLPGRSIPTPVPDDEGSAEEGHGSDHAETPPFLTTEPPPADAPPAAAGKPAVGSAGAIPTPATGPATAAAAGDKAGGAAGAQGDSVTQADAPASLPNGAAPAAVPAAGTPSTAAPRGHLPPAGSSSFQLRSAAANRLRSRPVRCANLQQAYGQLLESVRFALHQEAVRVAQLEAENTALQKTLAVMRQQQARAERPRTAAGGLRHSASAVKAVSAAGAEAGEGEGQQAQVPGEAGADAGVQVAVMAPASHRRRRQHHRHSEGMGEGGSTQGTLSMGSDDDDEDDDDEALLTLVALGADESEDEDDEDDEDEGSEVEGSQVSSVRTADEDAFDVTEAFDEGVDYSILDRPDAPHADEAALPHSGRLLGRRTVSPKQRLAHMPASGASRRKRHVQDAGSAGNETDLDEAKVLNALEVVRQVEYVEKLHEEGGLTSALLSAQAPPPPSSSPPAEGSGDGAPGGMGPGYDDEEEESSDEEDAASVARAVRTRLPAPKPLGKGFSIWSLLKNMIGKDLTRITMPATINEPTSTLQRLSEGLEYSCLLDQAAAESAPVDRLMLVAVWVLTCYNSQAFREGKPFNPLLGETYEWQAPDKRTRYMCEQVSHHPPVLAYIADSQAGWELQGELETKTKFWGKSIEVMLTGVEGLLFKTWGEEYRFNRATICVHDVILGSYWTEIYGKVKITSPTTGHYAVVNLKPCRGKRAQRGQCEGTVYDAQGREIWNIGGSVHESICAQLTPQGAKLRGLDQPPAPRQVWAKDPYPEDAAEQYWFTRFAIGLNDPADPIAPYLPPTDTRFRPDQRALELGEWSRATTEKLRLEEKQRQVRRARAAQGITYAPLWFKQTDATALWRVPDQPGFVWRFNPEYWARHATKDWSVCPDLYSTKDFVVAVPKAGVQPPSP